MVLLGHQFPHRHHEHDLVLDPGLIKPIYNLILLGGSQIAAQLFQAQVQFE